MKIKPANVHSLDGLMKWLARQEWKGEFEEIFDLRLMPACDKLGVDVDEAVSKLGRDWFMGTVWSCAFETF